MQNLNEDTFKGVMPNITDRGCCLARFFSGSRPGLVSKQPGSASVSLDRNHMYALSERLLLYVFLLGGANINKLMQIKVHSVKIFKPTPTRPN